MILPPDTDVAVSLDVCWIFDIVQLRLGLESQRGIQSRVRKRAGLFSGAFPRVSCLHLLLLSSLYTFRALLFFIFFLISGAFDRKRRE